jgi:hypothetical protein
MPLPPVAKLFGGCEEAPLETVGGYGSQYSQRETDAMRMTRDVPVTLGTSLDE